MGLIYDNLSDLPHRPKIGGGIMLDGIYSGDTYCCVHCSAAWHPVPGSGRKRGYCQNCRGLVCGSKLCMDGCIPLEARLQGWEQGLSRNEVLKRMDSNGHTIAL